MGGTHCCNSIHMEFETRKKISTPNNKLFNPMVVYLIKAEKDAFLLQQQKVRSLSECSKKNERPNYKINLRNDPRPKFIEKG